MGRLEGKVAIVTNGGSGIAAGIVECFAREGAKIIVADGNGNAGKLAVSQIVSRGGDAVFLETDTSDGGQIEAMIEAGVSRYGAADIMVAASTALGQNPCQFADMDDTAYDYLFDAGVRNIYLCCKSIIPQFRQQGNGNILVTVSGPALRPRPDFVIQGAVNGAVLNLIKGLALELAPEGFRVNGLCPGPGEAPLPTKLTGGVFSSEGQELFRANLPLGRMIAPRDVGEAAVFLASDVEARTITGCILPVESGCTI